MENTILCVTTTGGLTTTMTILSAEASAIKSDDHQAACSVIYSFWWAASLDTLSNILWSCLVFVELSFPLLTLKLHLVTLILCNVIAVTLRELTEFLKIPVFTLLWHCPPPRFPPCSSVGMRGYVIAVTLWNTDVPPLPCCQWLPLASQWFDHGKNKQMQWHMMLKNLCRDTPHFWWAGIKTT
jgi:hypothetical protein